MRGDPTQRPQRQELRADESPSPSAFDRDAAGPQSDEVEDVCQSRACVLGDQADLRVGQSPVPGAREEYPLVADQLWLGKSVCGTEAPLGRGLAGGGANGVAGSLTVGEPQEKRSRISGCPAGCLC